MKRKLNFKKETVAKLEYLNSIRGGRGEDTGKYTLTTYCPCPSVEGCHPYTQTCPTSQTCPTCEYSCAPCLSEHIVCP